MYRVQLSLLAQGTFHTQSRSSTLVCYVQSQSFSVGTRNFPHTEPGRFYPRVLCTESSFLYWHKELSTHRAGPVLPSCVMYRVKLSLLAQRTFHTQSRAGSTLVCYEESSCCTQSQGPDPLSDNDFRSTQSYIPPPLTMIFVRHRATFPLHGQSFFVYLLLLLFLVVVFVVVFWGRLFLCVFCVCVFCLFLFCFFVVFWGGSTKSHIPPPLTLNCPSYSYQNTLKVQNNAYFQSVLMGVLFEPFMCFYLVPECW